MKFHLNSTESLKTCMSIEDECSEKFIKACSFVKVTTSKMNITILFAKRGIDYETSSVKVFKRKRVIFVQYLNRLEQKV